LARGGTRPRPFSSAGQAKAPGRVHFPASGPARPRANCPCPKWDPARPPVSQYSIWPAQPALKKYELRGPGKGGQRTPGVDTFFELGPRLPDEKNDFLDFQISPARRPFDLAPTTCGPNRKRKIENWGAAQKAGETGTGKAAAEDLDQHIGRGGLRLVAGKMGARETLSWMKLKAFRGPPPFFFSRNLKKRPVVKHL